MAHYAGRPRFEWDEDGRIMTLLNRFAFIDDESQVWSVPALVKVDGASIPRFAWSLIGSPFVGRYRKATVVHDWYCVIRTRTWKTTHRMFYEAMRTSKVGGAKARILYGAVYYAGPRWAVSADYKPELAEPIAPQDYSAIEQDRLQPADHVRSPAKTLWHRREPDPDAFIALCDDLATQCETPAEIEAMIDARMGATE